MHMPLKTMSLVVAILLLGPAAMPQQPKPSPARPAGAFARQKEAGRGQTGGREAGRDEAGRDEAGGGPPVSDEENYCIQCHAQLTEKDQERFLVTAKDLAADIHWQKGLRCQDCHGGDPTVLEIKAHQAKEEFKAVKSPADVPEFCGKCHADIEYMRHYTPSPRTDQLAEYWTSGHGMRLKQAGDLKVATCISCHDKPHGSGAGPDEARRPAGGRPGLARLPHPPGQDLFALPFGRRN